MAFRIQDPVTGLFWKMTDEGTRIKLKPDGDVYVQTDDGALQNQATGLYIVPACTPLNEARSPQAWTVAADGSLITGDALYAVFSEPWESVVVGRGPRPWVLVPLVAAPAPVEPEPEPESEDEDVPVTRGSALIEEALNVQAADDAPDDDKDIE